MTDNLDITLAGLGFFLSISLTLYLQIALQRYVFTTVGVICIIIFAVYLILRLKFSDRPIVDIEAGKSTYLLLNIVFLALLCYVIFALRFRPELYIRPLGYFIATAAIVVVLVIEILVLPRQKYATHLVLFKTILIGLIAAFSPQLIFPSLVGIDPWWHQWAVNHVTQTGHVAGIGKYSMMPAFHLMTSSTSLITGSDYKFATMFSVGAPQVICNIFFTFLIGKFIHSTKAGLLAALFFAVASVAIHFGFWTVPTSMGVIFITMILYLLLKLRHEKPGISLLIVVLSSIALLLTNPVPVVFLLSTLPLLWLGFVIYKLLRYKDAVSNRFFIAAAGVFAVITLVWFTFGTGHMNSLLRSIASGFGIESGRPLTLPYTDTLVLLEEETTLNTDIMQYGSTAPFSELLFNYLGLFLFFAIAFIGVLFMLSKRNRTAYSFAFSFAGITLLAANFFGTIADLRLLTQRWIFFLQFMLAIPLGIALMWLGNLSQRRYISVCIVSVLSFILAFSMIMSTQANLDNRTFSSHKLGNNPITASELQAVGTITEIWNGTVSSDREVISIARSALVTIDTDDISKQLYIGDFKDLRNTLVFIRGSIVHQPFRSSYGVINLNYDPYKRLAKQGFSHIYTCGSTSAFIK